MRLLAPFSVRQKLLAVVLLTTLTALLVAIAVMVGFDLRNYRQSLISDMPTQADLLGRTTAPALTFDDPRVAQENLELLHYRPQIRAAAIYNARGKIFASYSGTDGREVPKLPEADVTRIEGNELVLFKRIVDSREILGTVYLRADYELYDRLVGYLGIAAIVAAIAMLVAYVLSRQLQHIVTSPLLAIAEVAREVTEKRAFSLRAPKLSKDEIGMLAESFNTMLAEIERATRDLQASNEVLGREIAEHNRAEQEILRLNRELEQRVKERTAQLEYTNGELEAFCYSVSHDLRAPLRAIDGFSQALLEDFPKDVPEEARRYLSRIRSSTQRMGQLIEDLLNLSRVSRGSLERRDADISELARQVVTELQTREPQRKVDISVWDGMRANADSRLLRAALENLIGNAWKFSSKTDKPRIEIGSLSDDGRAVFYVRDNGAGFDMAYANKLFGAFQRLHSGNEYQGTGIGLATVQRIVHRHGGRIRSDFSMPDFDGLAALKIARDFAPRVPFIFVSGTIGEERAIEAIRLGATDYVLKDNLRRLGTALRRALAEARDRERVRAAEEERARLVEILEATSDYVGMSDPQGRRIYLNAAGRKLTGVPEHPAQGALSPEIHPGWVREIIQSEALPAAARDGLWQGETAMLNSEGKEIPVSQVVIAHRAPDGGIRFFSTIARDISERK